MNNEEGSDTWYTAIDQNQWTGRPAHICPDTQLRYKRISDGKPSAGFYSMGNIPWKSCKPEFQFMRMEDELAYLKKIKPEVKEVPSNWGDWTD